ncbi:YbjN domain-containing protein [Streptomyces sp. LP05-1]|uniref:YbjN domain-containing protein n=1 Tax=Streptomyces pyxinae TaxID=2970734 RepID=A0ABT2CMW1_9ACTN|nr:YbjN domain-containing protein [Streptomyces sp. LP05-1]MCS0638773.1 YbjN domain-containing protein [Streptomyces sp. LP05-1]
MGTTDPAGSAESPAAARDADARRVIEGTLDDAGLSWESPAPGSYVVTLPGTHKLSTTLSLRLGNHSLSLNAFVVRHPDENASGVHRWLLERNLKLYGVGYAVDGLGDIYLTGKLPRAAVTPEELDRLLGSVLEAADGAFNTLLELGFASAIRKEYAWRVARGESTRNLAAFAHLTRPSSAQGSPESPESRDRVPESPEA